MLVGYNLMTTRPKNARAAQGLSAALAGSIAFFSLLPAGVAVSTGWSDKVEHALAYAILAVCTRLGWRDWSALRVFGFCTVYGALIELGQLFSPGRHADGWDLLADAIGAGFGLAGLLIWERRFGRVDKPS